FHGHTATSAIYPLSLHDALPISEMLEALGVYTSKTFSVIETGEELVRGDEPSPARSAVLVRLSHSHIRIGTFQRLAVHEEDEHIDRKSTRLNSSHVKISYAVFCL